MIIRSLLDLKPEIEIENGRAVIELSLSVLPVEEDSYFVYLWTAEELLAFHCVYPAREEEPCCIRLVHPHLWQGPDDPYLYRLEIYGALSGLLGSIPFPVRKMTKVSGKGFLLNGCPFTPKTVYYEDFCICSNRKKEMSEEQVERQLCSLVKMGANMIAGTWNAGMSLQEQVTLQAYCDRLGLLLCGDYDSVVTVGSEGCIFGKKLFSENNLPTDAYYFQKACWSDEAFVYVSRGSLRRQADGLFQVTVYSNQKRVALFVNDVLFGLQDDGPEFFFQDIPVRGFPLMLAASAGDCSMSIACY